jgi:uncharacterized protein (DUF302 family)
MRTFFVFVLGLVLGALAVAGGVLWKGSSLAVNEVESPSTVDETVARLTKAAEAEGWKVLGVRKLHESIKQGTGLDVRPVHVVELCHPAHAGKILKEDAARPVSVFMPCSIAVYEKTDGKVYVASTNATLLGRVFGGVVAEVMGGPVAEAQARFVTAATTK